MGSRVVCQTLLCGELAGIVVGASKGGTEGWIIHVRLDIARASALGRAVPPMLFRPSEIRAAD